ncbi:tRNA (guanosine(37)-N1)-methyltransferase TrmD [Desulfobacterales bacterium HSG16]|nr:tRNA (guanosine(37)-N1)-methyltransferase TrmD [Desulfobacterales bacterium HSG16]
MNFVALTIFPEMFTPLFEHGIIRKAIEEEKICASAANIRDYAQGRHHITDDRPYGGGCGMVLKPEPVFAAVQAAKESMPDARTVLMSPQGRKFNHNIACELAELEGLIFVCGRYEGVDERICHTLIDDELSVGDYILTGGELAAMSIIDAVTRLIPGVLGGDESAEKDSFSSGLLEHAHYTRPRSYADMDVPEVLFSGNHKEIDKWRLQSSLIRTFLKRKDLFIDRRLDPDEVKILKQWCVEIEEIIQAQSISGADTPSCSQ